MAGTEFRVLVTAELLMSYTEKERVRESRTFLLLLGYSFALLEAAVKGGVDFENICLTHSVLCQIVIGPQIQNYTLKCWF